MEKHAEQSHKIKYQTSAVENYLSKNKKPVKVQATWLKQAFHPNKCK
jgi:hypothetical protein